MLVRLFENMVRCMTDAPKALQVRQYFGEFKQHNFTSNKEQTKTYMEVIWQVELLLKEQSQATELSNPLTIIAVLQFPSPLQGSLLKSQSLFPNFFAISFNAFTAHQENEHMSNWKKLSSRLQ